MTPPPQIRARHSGVTLLELMIVVSIGSLLTLAITTLLSAVGRSAKKAEQFQTSMAEETVGNRQIWFDLRLAGISFNFLSMGPCGSPPNPKDFYDFLPDTPCQPSASDDCTRSKVLRFDAGPSDPTELVLALSKGGLAPALPLSPLQFYDAVEAADYDQDGTLTFNSNNLKNVLTGLNSYGVNLMAEGTILRFYSPVTMRPGATTGTLDMKVPPRLVSLVGIVRSGQLVTTRPSWLSCERHPSMTTVDLSTGGNGYTALDQFFRLMPPVGGKSAFGMVAPIDVVRYRMERITVRGSHPSGRLTRDRYDGATDTWIPTHTVADGVTKVEFSRRNIAVPSIKATITMDKAAF